MYFYSEEIKVKSFILLMWFSFTFEKQKLLLREGSKVPINTFEQTVRLSGNATCVLQFLICELAALTCPVLTSSLNHKTQTWWRKIEKPENLDSGMVSLTYSMETAECHWVKMQKERLQGNTQSSLLFNYVNSRLPFSVLCLSIDEGSVYISPVAMKILTYHFLL